MARNNAKVFLDENYFVSLDTSGDNNNVIVIGNFKYGIASDGTANNPVYCSFRGEYLKQITDDVLDEADSVGCFVWVSDINTNQLKVVADKTIESREDAVKYITGMLVDYQLAPLTAAGTYKDALYEVSTYLSDGTLVSPAIACSLPDVCRKIQALEAHLDLNEAGYYEHVVRISLVRK